MVYFPLSFIQLIVYKYNQKFFTKNTQLFFSFSQCSWKVHTQNTQVHQFIPAGETWDTGFSYTLLERDKDYLHNQQGWHTG